MGVYLFLVTKSKYKTCNKILQAFFGYFHDKSSTGTVVDFLIQTKWPQVTYQAMTMLLVYQS
ncbi:hypothetical protein CRI85_02930 [Leuconostoc pseudomesenteroides]|nr:hypothetical protein [Leuconostoc pseudomesenteroides]